MGGIGSGRHVSTKPRLTTEEYLRLDIRRMKRQGFFDLNSGSEESGQLPIFATSTGAFRMSVQRLADDHHVRAEVMQLDELGFPVRVTADVISLNETPCNFGGRRLWFTCSSCLKRCGVLYWRTGCFKCRSCHNLTYASTYETDAQRANRRAVKFQRRLGRLGKVPDVFDPGRRPPGMHRKTFNRIAAELDRCDEIVARDFVLGLRQVERLLSRPKQ